MFWGHEEVARFGGVMRSLFGDIIASRMIRIVPIASERLPQYGIQGFFNPRRFNVPSTEVEFDDRNESSYRIIDIWHW